MQAELMAAIAGGGAKSGLKRVQSKAAMDMAALRAACTSEEIETQGGGAR